MESPRPKMAFRFEVRKKIGANINKQTKISIIQYEYHKTLSSMLSLNPLKKFFILFYRPQCVQDRPSRILLLVQGRKAYQFVNLLYRDLGTCGKLFSGNMKLCMYCILSTGANRPLFEKVLYIFLRKNHVKTLGHVCCK
jgi:hypothetical protein